MKKHDGKRRTASKRENVMARGSDFFPPARFYPEFKTGLMTASLEQALQGLGPDNPFVKTVLNVRSPKAAATEIVNGTKLADPEVRKKLVQGGESAVAPIPAPVDALPRNLHPTLRVMVKRTEENQAGQVHQPGG